MSIRRTALWYPSLPPDGLDLNEDSFTGQHPLFSGYQPLSWIHFGGKEGKSLKHVRGLLVQYSYGLHGLQFVYDEAHEKRVSDKLGRCKESDLPGTLFSLDGAEGERIELVHIGTRCYDDEDLPADPPAFLRHGVVKFHTVKLSYFARLNKILTLSCKDNDKSRPNDTHWRAIR